VLFPLERRGKGFFGEEREGERGSMGWGMERERESAVMVVYY
jgi:hypothetical protein